MEKVSVNVGNTNFILNNGEILSVSREGYKFTPENERFEEFVRMIFIIASTNHKESLLVLIKQLKPKKDDKTYNALLALKQCELTVALDSAVNIALGKKNAKQPVFA